MRHNSQLDTHTHPWLAPLAPQSNAYEALEAEAQTLRSRNTTAAKAAAQQRADKERCAAV